MKPTWSQELYIKAFKFAARAHKGQKVPGSDLPYIAHLSMVAMEIMTTLTVEHNLNGDLAVQCALLHDTIEDTEVSCAELKDEFVPEVAAGVKALTKDKAIKSKDERMLDSLERIKKQPKEVWMVKLADRITNLQPPPSYWDQEKILQYEKEARLIYDNLKDGNKFLADRLKHKIDNYNVIPRTKPGLKEIGNKMSENKQLNKFSYFIDWLTEKCSESYTTPTIGRRTKVSVVFKNNNLTVSYGSSGNSGELDKNELLSIFDRYHKLGDWKHQTSQYTDPKWKKTPNRILAPYAAALIRDFDNNLRNNEDMFEDMDNAHSFIEWFWSKPKRNFRLTNFDDGLCQCETEHFIDSANRPDLMRSFLLLAVFIDQMMYTHFQSIYQEFRSHFYYPKLFSHPGNGMASPSWFVYSFHEFDKKMRWHTALPVAHALLGDLFKWLKKFPNSEELVKRFRALMDIEIMNEFEPESVKKLSEVLSEALS